MPTAARLKDEIDRGRAGSKVANIDPAAAPLGTDDEAAGKPPSPAELKLAFRNEIGNSAASQDEADHGVTIYVVAIGIWSAALFTAISLVRP